MGLQWEYLTFIEDALSAAGLLPAQAGRCRLCELGNQQMRGSVIGLTAAATGKAYFTDAGFEHTSIDLNGQDGALPYDLSRPLVADAALSLGEYDVVTNSGTSEHVVDQYECFRNIHRLARVGGVMIHLSPHGRSWSTRRPHGAQDYSFAFFRGLGAVAGYQTVRDDRIEIGQSRLVIIAMAFRKAHDAFVSRDAFADCLAAVDVT